MIKRRTVLLLLAAATTFAPAPAAHADFRDESEARGRLPGEILPPVPRRAHELAAPQATPILRRLRRDPDGRWRPAQGALSGRSVYLSPGHGWYHHSANSWSTQRPNSLGICEDLSNADGIDQFLVPMLLAAGALVVPVREIDPQTAMVILDTSDGTKNPARGRYLESGDPAAFSDSTLAGWGHPTLPITGAVNPFSLGGNRLLAGATTETARATFILNVPRAGHYNVYLSYSMYSGRASDAHVSVRHAGGEARFLVDQRRQGGSWLLLGRFFFLAGENEQRGAVVVTNETKDAGSNISVDAVRLGGGLGVIDRGAGASKQARADEAGRYHAQFAGAPESVYNASSGEDNTDDVSTRSRLAQWLHAPGEPAVFLSHHSNAWNGATRGSESYIYGPNAPDGSYQPTQAVLTLGADKLAKAVHGEIVADLRAAWEPAWADRGVKSAYFGEINPSHQDEMPAMLVEIAFHDEAKDVAALKEGPFRRLVARSILKGIIRYFAQQAATAAALPPEPPRAVRAIVTGSGEVTVSWDPPASGGVLGEPAQGYRVHRSSEGYGFDDGADTGGKTSYTLKGLPAGQPVFVRVTAHNLGGESLPSPTLAVRAAGAGASPLLLVTGFDRTDGELNLRPTYPKIGAVDRLFPEAQNDGSYLVPHARALEANSLAFDACSHDAVESGAVDPRAYRLVIWQAGMGLGGGVAIPPAARARLGDAHGAGTGLIVSGATVARRLGASSAPAADRQFLEEVLHAGLGTGSGGLAIAGGAGALEGLAPFSLADGAAALEPGYGRYEVRAPDTLAARVGALVIARYGSGGADPPAAVQAGGATEGRPCALLFAFPLESILEENARREILTRALALCDLKSPPPGDAGPRDGGGGGSGDLPPVAGDPGIGASDGCGCSAGLAPGASVFAPLLLLGLVVARRLAPRVLLALALLLLGAGCRREDSGSTPEGPPPALPGPTGRADAVPRRLPTIAQIRWEEFPRPAPGPPRGRSGKEIALRPGRAVISKALEAAGPGDTLVLAPGTYAEGIEGEHRAILVEKEGIAIRAEGGRAKIVPAHAGVKQGLVIEASGVQVQGLELSGFVAVGVSLGKEGTTLKGIVLSDLRVSFPDDKEWHDGIVVYPDGRAKKQPVIDGLLLRDVSVEGASLGISCNAGPCRSLWLENVLVRDAGGSGSGADAISMENGDNVVLLNVTATGATADGIDLKAENVLVARCAVHHVERNGIKLWLGGDIQSCLVDHAGADAAVVFNGPGRYRLLHSLIAHHNWDEGKSYSLTSGAGETRGAAEVEIRNSIFYRLSGGLFFGEGTRGTLRQNLFAEIRGKTLLRRAVGGQELEVPLEGGAAALERDGLGAGNLVGRDPRFVDAAKADFRVRRGGGGGCRARGPTPVLDGARPAEHALPLDLAGRPRVQGGAPDLGPYEQE